MTTFVDRLRSACSTAKSLVCVGLDVNPDMIPIDDITEFNKAIIDVTCGYVCAYKPNLAFYEALGIPGLKTLDQTIDHIRAVAPDAIIIGDCKRGDIDSSAVAYAHAMFNVWGFDAVTVNPWGGMDTVEPWLTDPERGAFIWCRGSNPGSADLQDLDVADGQGGDEPIYLRVARQANHRAAGVGNLGLVVGATAPEQLTAIRDSCPNLPFLIPGVGAQGGDLKTAVLAGMSGPDSLVIINASRSIIYAASGNNWADAAQVAATGLRDSINQVLVEAGLGWP
jgi:orotidine-5'-phosphate decarboxylase